MRRSRTWPAQLAVAAVLATISANGVSLVTAPGAGAETGFVPGSGAASARVTRLAARSSGAAVALGVGGVKARYQGAQGNAHAAGFEPGLLGLAMTTPFVCQIAPAKYFPAGVPPQPLSVSSGDGPAAEHSSSAGEGTPAQVARQEASATPNSSAASRVDGVAFGLPGILELAGGTASSAAQLTPGTQRHAEARSHIGTLSLAGGLVRLEDLTWTAGHRTGGEAAVAGGFTAGSISLAGVPLPAGDPASVAASLNQVNEALVPLGLALRPPAVVDTGNEVQVTPLRLSVEANPALRPAAGQVLAGIQPARDAVLSATAPFKYGENCGLQTGVGFGFLMVDLATVVLGDRGGLDLDFGGARAGTEAPVYDNPFDSGFGVITPPTPAPRPPKRLPGPAETIGEADTAIRPAPARRPAGPPATLPAPATSSAEEVAAPPMPGPVYRPAVGLGPPVCQTTHPHGSPGCARGPGAGRLAAWLALAAVAALAGADRIRQSRPARTPEVAR